MKNIRLGEVLVEYGYISEAQVAQALALPRLPAQMKAVALVACLPGPFYRWLCRLLLTDRR